MQTHTNERASYYRACHACMLDAIPEPLFDMTVGMHAATAYVYPSPQ